MHWTGWLVVVLGLQLGGWLTFDGARAFVVGDYVTPSSGDYAGQLGPWSKLVAAVGMAPRSSLMKGAHIVLGLAWLGVVTCFALRFPWAWRGALVCALASLWYLPFGTLIGLIQIALLLTTLRPSAA